MVARKTLENWLYWLVLDAICIPVFIERGLPLTAALYATYLVLAALAYQRWRRQLGGQVDPVHA
jgi:nicotinamide mononucleotide transporter